MKTINLFAPWVHGHELRLKNDMEVTEIIILGTLSSPIAYKVEQINTTRCAKLETDTQLLVGGTNLQKITTPPKNIWKIKMEPNTTAGAQFSTPGT